MTVTTNIQDVLNGLTQQTVNEYIKRLPDLLPMSISLSIVRELP